MITDIKELAAKTRAMFEQCQESNHIDNAKYGYYIYQYRKRLNELQEKYIKESTELSKFYNQLWIFDCYDAPDEDDDVCWEAA